MSFLLVYECTMSVLGFLSCILAKFIDCQNFSDFWNNSAFYHDTPFCLLSTCPGIPSFLTCSDDILQSFLSMSAHDKLNQLSQSRTPPLMVLFTQDIFIKNRKLPLNPVLSVFEKHWATLSLTLWLLRRDGLYGLNCVPLWVLVPLDASKNLALVSKCKCASRWVPFRFSCLDHSFVNLLERESGLWRLCSWQAETCKLELATISRVSSHGSYTFNIGFY